MGEPPAASCLVSRLAIALEGALSYRVATVGFVDFDAKYHGTVITVAGGRVVIRWEGICQVQDSRRIAAEIAGS